MNICVQWKRMTGHAAYCKCLYVFCPSFFFAPFGFANWIITDYFSWISWSNEKKMCTILLYRIVSHLLTTKWVPTKKKICTRLNWKYFLFMLASGMFNNKCFMLTLFVSFRKFNFENACFVMQIQALRRRMNTEATLYVYIYAYRFVGNVANRLLGLFLVWRHFFFLSCTLNGLYIYMCVCVFLRKNLCSLTWRALIEKLGQIRHFLGGSNVSTFLPLLITFFFCIYSKVKVSERIFIEHTACAGVFQPKDVCVCVFFPAVFSALFFFCTVVNINGAQITGQFNYKVCCFIYSLVVHFFYHLFHTFIVFVKRAYLWSCDFCQLS